MGRGKINECLLGAMTLALAFAVVTKAFGDGGEMSGSLLPITYATPESERRFFEKKSFCLMRLLGMHTNDTHSVAPEWVCPTSVVVNAMTYSVVTNDHFCMRGFEVRSPTAVVARGGYELEDNAYEARIAAFGEKAQTSMRLELYARSFQLVPLDAPTNSFIILRKRFIPWYREMAAFGKAWLEIETQTNTLEFVTAIMNAGYEAARNQ